MEDLNQLEIKEYNSIIVGSGAAGFNCALHLVIEGISSDKIAIVTFVVLNEDEVKQWKPKIVITDEKNNIVEKK